jgi:hypothetical protein
VIRVSIGPVRKVPIASYDVAIMRILISMMEAIVAVLKKSDRRRNPIRLPRP